MLTYARFLRTSPTSLGGKCSCPSAQAELKEQTLWDLRVEYSLRLIKGTQILKIMLGFLFLAVTSYHKLHSLKQHPLITSQLCDSDPGSAQRLLRLGSDVSWAGLSLLPDSFRLLAEFASLDYRTQIFVFLMHISFKLTPAPPCAPPLSPSIQLPG